MGRELGWRTTALYTAAITGCGILFAMLIDLGLNLQLTIPETMTTTAHHHHHFTVWSALVIGLVVLILLNGTIFHLLKRFLAKPHA